MKKLMMLLCAFSLGLALAVPARATLLINGGAENGLENWDVPVQSGVVDSVKSPDGSNPEPQHFFSFTNGGTGTNPVTMSQSGIGGWEAGADFVLSGYFLTGADDYGVARLTLLSTDLSGIPNGDIVATTEALVSSDMDWTLFTLSLTVPEALIAKAWNVQLFGYPDSTDPAASHVFWDGLKLNPTATPEPASMVLLGTGLIGMAWGIRRKLD